MYYVTEMGKIPDVRAAYTVTRKTVWQVADPYHILIYIREGECEIETDGKKFALEKGDFFFIPASQPYIRRPKEDGFCTISYIHTVPQEDLIETDKREAFEKAVDLREKMDTELVRDRPEAPLPGFHFLLIPRLFKTGEKREKFEKILFELENVYLKNRIESHLFASASLGLLLTMITAGAVSDLLASEGEKRPQKVSRVLRKAVLIIRRSPNFDIPIPELARQCTVSKQQLIRNFKAELGTTPGAYMTALRINRAKELLATQSALSIGEVSDEVGYEDRHYFSRVFTKVTGETPTDFKNRVNRFLLENGNGT